MNLNIEAVKREADTQDVSNRSMAEAAGIDPGHMTRILQRKRPCSGHVYAALVRLFNVHPMVFIGSEKPEESIVDAAQALGVDPDRFEELHRTRFPELADTAAA